MKKSLLYLFSCVVYFLILALNFNLLATQQNDNSKNLSEFHLTKLEAMAQSNSEEGEEDCFIDCYPPCNEICAYNINGYFDYGIEEKICP